MNLDPDNLPVELATNSAGFQFSRAIFRLAVLAGLILIGLVWLILFQNIRDDYLRLYYSPRTENDSGLLGLPAFTWVVVGQIQQYLVLFISLAVSSFVYWFGIFRSSRRDWTAWLFSLTLVILALIPLGEPGLSLSDLEKLLHQLQSNLIWLASVMLVNIFFIFPNGKFVRRWIGWAAFAFNLTMIVFALLQAIADRGNWELAALLEQEYWIFIVVGFSAAGLLAFAGQIYRYRFVSTALEKQQTKWVLASLAVIPAYIFLGIFALILGIQSRFPNFFEFWNNVFVFLVATFLPISVAFAILRYHLWDVDLILRRTVVYSILTGFLGLLYFGIVALLQSTFLALSGQSSPAALVISTLAIAALFNPVRGRIQDFIDRRFYRRKYDAEKALAQFAATVRSETDLARLTEAMLAITRETIQPEASSLWLAKK